MLVEIARGLPLVAIFGGQFIVAVLITPFLVALAHRHGITDKPDNKLKAHTHETPHVGGALIMVTGAIAMIVAALVGRVTINSMHIVEIIAIAAIFTVGIIDDSFHVPVAIRMIFQCCIAGLLVFGGAIFAPTPYTAMNILITIVGIVAGVNALNLLDIMDGLAGGVSFFAILGLSVALFMNGAPPFYLYVGMATLVGIGAFLIANFLPNPKKIFLGDGGSTLLGVIIAILFIASAHTVSSGGAIASLLVLISIPIFELIFVSVMRIRKKKSPLVGSNDHFPLRVARIMGSQRRAVILIYLYAFLVFSIGVGMLLGWRETKLFLAAMMVIFYTGAALILARVEIE